MLAEWRGAHAAAAVNAAAPGPPAALPSLHIYCHVSVAAALSLPAALGLPGTGLRMPWPPAPPAARAAIFQRDLPLVLAALFYAERGLLAAAPHLAAAPVYLHLRTASPEADRVVPWGRFGDPATWRAGSA